MGIAPMDQYKHYDVKPDTSLDSISAFFRQFSYEVEEPSDVRSDWGLVHIRGGRQWTSGRVRIGKGSYLIKLVLYRDSGSVGHWVIFGMTCLLAAFCLHADLNPGKADLLDKD